MFFVCSPAQFFNRLLVVLGLFTALPSLAENKALFFSAGEKWVTADNDDSGLEQTLEQNFSPDDRARLKKALSDYAKNTDPEHNQIEHKRKLMKESISQRFNECNRDNDDSLDREETTLCLPQIARHFSYVDVDGDNVITLEELELAQAKSAERQRAAEAKMEAQRIQDAEAEIINKSKSKINKQVSNTRKRPI
jgi:hypothetical protein